MGHYCKICGTSKANEKFSGKGHKRHICKVCSKLPKDTLAEIKQMSELVGFLEQSHISKKNLKRLRELAEDENKGIAEKAQIILKVAEFHPYKKRRMKMLRQKKPSLILKLQENDLIFNFYGEKHSNSETNDLPSDEYEDDYFSDSEIDELPF